MGCQDRDLMRILASSCAYDDRWRMYVSLAREGPEPRPVLAGAQGRVIAVPDVGGLHHHDERTAASLCMLCTP
jgi:hypothetical protein